jgi:hypothetical protein
LEFFRICYRVFLKNPEVFFKNGQKQARELNFCMNMFRYIKYKIVYSELEFFGIRLRVFLKNPEIFFKNGQKLVLFRLGTS